MFTLDSLADLLRGSSLPESLQILAEYRHFGGELISTYIDVAALWREPSEVPEDNDLALSRISCLTTLLPLIEEPFCKWELPMSVPL